MKVMKLICKLYSYLFYKTYKLLDVFEQQWPQSARMTHILGVIFLTYVQYGYFLFLLNMLREKNAILESQVENRILMLLAFLTINSFIFIWKKRYKNVLREFENEPLIMYLMGYIVVIGFSIIGLTIFFTADFHA